RRALGARFAAVGERGAHANAMLGKTRGDGGAHGAGSDDGNDFRHAGFLAQVRCCRMSMPAKPSLSNDVVASAAKQFIHHRDTEEAEIGYRTECEASPLRDLGVSVVK